MSKLFGVETSYTHNRRTAGPGYISNTQYGIVTGTHAVDVIGDPALYRTGRAVYLHDFSMIDGCGTVSVLTDPTKSPFGVLAKSHALTPEGLFHTGDVANIITFGCVYMVCSSDMEYEKITFGKQVAVVRTWGSVVNADNEKLSPLSAIKTRWYFTGAVEFGAFDSRFGKVNVAEVMVVPGGIVDQHSGGDFVPKYGSHRAVGDDAWSGDIGHTYLLPNEKAAGGAVVEFEAYCNVMTYVKDLLSNEPEKLEDIESISRVSWSKSIDLDRATDADVMFGSTDPAYGVAVDISDGVGLFKAKFSVKRRNYDEMIPTWCSSNYAFSVKFKASSGRPAQNIEIPFIIRFEV